jgi:hypothetical protein
MSALKTIPGEPALPVQPIAHDQARAVLGQVMGLVAVTVAFTALGAYLGRDLSGATGLLLFIGAFACIIGLNIAAAKGREQLAIGLLFGLPPCRSLPRSSSTSSTSSYSRSTFSAAGASERLAFEQPDTDFEARRPR